MKGLQSYLSFDLNSFPSPSQMFGFPCCWQLNNILTLSLRISTFARSVTKNSQIFVTGCPTAYFLILSKGKCFWCYIWILLKQQAKANLPGFPFPVRRVCFWATCYGWPRDLPHLCWRNVTSTSENCRKASGVWPRKSKPSKTRQNFFLPPFHCFHFLPCCVVLCIRLFKTAKYLDIL